MVDTPPHGSSKLRILFADDDPAISLTFSWMLEALGHEVHVARDGPSAINAARSFMPQVLMLDINLPGISGYDICRTLRAEPQFEKSLFIAQTGWSDPEHYERSKTAGFHHHFVKPITINVIEKILASPNVEISS